MSTIRCLIADDEPIAREIVKNYVERTPVLELVATCKDAFEVLEVLKKERIDLIFLDINMPSLSGISLLKSLPNRPKVILTTAYPEFAVEGFELAVDDYLLKPISFERFFQAVMKVQFSLSNQEVSGRSDAEPQQEQSPIFVKSDKKLVRVLPEEIYCVEAYGNYIKIHADSIILTPQVMTDFIEKLPNQFVRTHKSFVVNSNHIKSLEGNMIFLTNDKEIPISRSYRKALLERLGF